MNLTVGAVTGGPTALPDSIAAEAVVEQITYALELYRVQSQGVDAHLAGLHLALALEGVEGDLQALLQLSLPV